MAITKEFVRIWNTVTEEYDVIEVTPDAIEVVVPVSPVEISQVVNETSSVTVVNGATVDQSTNQVDVIVLPNVIDISQDNNVTLVDRSSNETAIINTTNQTTVITGPIAPPTSSETSGLNTAQVDARVDLKVPTGTKPAEWSLLATDEELTSGLDGKLDSSTVIPTKTSELTNDSGFLTSETDSYTKTEEDTLLAGKADSTAVTTEIATAVPTGTKPETWAELTTDEELQAALANTGAGARYRYFALRTVNGTTLQLEDNVTSIPAMIDDGWTIIDGLTSDSIILTNDILQRSN